MRRRARQRSRMQAQPAVPASRPARRPGRRHHRRASRAGLEPTVQRRDRVRRHRRPRERLCGRYTTRGHPAESSDVASSIGGELDAGTGPRLVCDRVAGRDGPCRPEVCPGHQRHQPGPSARQQPRMRPLLREPPGTSSVLWTQRARRRDSQMATGDRSMSADPRRAEGQHRGLARGDPPPRWRR
jgi:hypothetical protein